MEEANARLFVIAAPSGAGKTTLVKKLVDRNAALKFSVSYTTRKQRTTEVEARDYFFVTEEEFHKLKEEGALLESALVFDNHYGTGRDQVVKHLASGNDVILEIDWQGARQVRRAMPDCRTVFILPPSRTELEHRLRGRRTDSETIIARRLADALDDMAHWDEFDYVIVNDDLENAVQELESVVAGAGLMNTAGNQNLVKRIRNILV